ncbi:fructosamine kinase family protein [uncultured Limosilactobacillus sp.]|uniref:fructosamine kinase family protein n=1 Tax=uncultured Limosilactobacillus sp. TaxID=2837629 RepID=UPI0025E92BED|nr:fructosamine kinase family protein [uncultured Limosilactobacillus sp.]
METDKWFASLPIAPIDSWEPVSGGDINEAYRVVADGIPYFVKVQPHQPTQYFAHEQNGLKALGSVINTPKVIATGEINGNAYLILNWIEEGPENPVALGHAIAKLHQKHADQFGFSTNHRTRVLLKDNSWNDSWRDFYLNQRLAPEINIAKKLGRWNDWRNFHFQKMTTKFDHYYKSNSVTPSLLHGDLWAGNYMFNQNGTPTLIDPDALYGDREYDLAMTTIFGGFTPAFYQAYNEAYPLTPGFEDRLPWYQFYYLCMHLILFGETYGPAVDHILDQY